MSNHLFHVHNQVPVQHSVQHRTKQTEPNVSFQDVLQKEQLTFSKHAKDRMQERNISMNQTQLDTMHHKLQEAKAKGVTDSLVLTDDAALLVSVKNNVVVTALDRSEMESKLFTNINGAIVLD